MDLPQVVANEAWAMFWLAFVYDTCALYNRRLDYDNQLTVYDYYNCENGLFGFVAVDSFAQSVNNYGDGCIGSVTGMLWEIYDDVEDDFDAFGDTTWPRQVPPDGIGDYMCAGIMPIIDALMYKSTLPQTMEEFWDSWFEEPSNDYSYKMRDIWYEHGVDKSCCIALRGNADCSDDEEPDISDINRLIDFLYLSHEPLCCFEEADTYPDGMIDVSDISKIIDFLYLSHTPLPNCP